MNANDAEGDLRDLNFDEGMFQNFICLQYSSR